MPIHGSCNLFSHPASHSVRSLLQRNLAKCPATVKCYCYNTFVRPILEYASTVWSPYHEHNIYKLEMVQRRAARFVMNNYNRTASVTEMLNSLQWQTLEKRRNNLRASLMYKIINDMVDINVHQQFRPSNTTTRGHHQRFLQLPTRVDAYMNSFFPFTIKLWNQLDDHIRPHQVKP